MKTSDKGIILIKQFEGLRLQSYRCVGNVWTIGWGSTVIYGIKVKEGDFITIEEAEQILKLDIKKFEDLVNSRIYTKINQNQFDDLVSHSYNTGGSDTLFHLINKCEGKEKIRDWFENTYISARGKLLNGLIARRKSEANLYFSNEI